MPLGTQPDYDFETGISELTPRQATVWGFHSGRGSTLLSRTIMLQDLSKLMMAIPPGSETAVYANAIVDENCLGKPTVTTRGKSLGHLRKLYALDETVLFFRVFRDLWDRDRAGRPLLTVLLALTRDPLLRASFSAVAKTPIGSGLKQETFRFAMLNSVSHPISAISAAALVARASSSWAQSGHLSDARRKIRQVVMPTPAVATFALLIGYATGARGALLLETPWATVLDADCETLMELASEAHRQGLLTLMCMGDVIDVSFASLLTETEIERVDGLY